MILYIFGAGHGATEILEDSLYYINGKQKYFTEKVLVEDNPHRKDIKPISDILNLEVQYGIISAYYPGWKTKLDKLFPSINWVSAISPKANVLLKDLPVGLNVRSGAFIGSTVKIGRHVRINFGANISFCCEVGDYSFIGINTSMCGESKVGIGSLIYSHAVILNNIRVGDNTIIGAGSIVTKDIPDNVTAYGNPCRIVRYNDYIGGER